MKIAIDAIGAAGHPHHFLSVTKTGHSAIVHTAGNADCHVILRGGKEPNYDSEHVRAAAQELAKAGMPTKMMVDCSHANSRKDFRRQKEVAQDIAVQLAAGENDIMGVMGGKPLGRRASGQARSLRTKHYRCLYRLGYHGRSA